MSSVDPGDEILDVIENLAFAGGLNTRRRGQLLQIMFDTGQGRSQTVFAGGFGITNTGRRIIRLLSPCMRLSNFKNRRLPGDLAVELLQRNSDLGPVAFCIMTLGDDAEELLCVKATPMIDPMGSETFYTICSTVASVADHFEQEHDVDEF